MDITGISALEPTSLGSQTNQTDSLDKDAFMKLLVQQLQNQDPMQPTSNEQFVSQLASFSSLEQMQSLNDNVIGLALLQQDNALLSQLTQGSALIGQEVRYFDADSQSEKTGLVSSVKIEDGFAQLKVGSSSVPLGQVLEVLGAPKPEAGADETPKS